MLLLFELIIVNFGGVSGIMLGIERTIDCRTPVDEGLFCCLGLIGTNEDMEGRKLELVGFLITGIVIPLLVATIESDKVMADFGRQELAGIR